MESSSSEHSDQSAEASASESGIDSEQDDNLVLKQEHVKHPVARVPTATSHPTTADNSIAINSADRSSTNTINTASNSNNAQRKKVAKLARRARRKRPAQAKPPTIFGGLFNRKWVSWPMHPDRVPRPEYLPSAFDKNSLADDTIPIPPSSLVLRYEIEASIIRASTKLVRQHSVDNVALEVGAASSGATTVQETPLLDDMAPKSITQYYIPKVHSRLDRSLLALGRTVYGHKSTGDPPQPPRRLLGHRELLSWKDVYRVLNSAKVFDKKVMQRSAQRCEAMFGESVEFFSASNVQEGDGNPQGEVRKVEAEWKAGRKKKVANTYTGFQFDSVELL